MNLISSKIKTLNDLKQFCKKYHILYQIDNKSILLSYKRSKTDLNDVFIRNMRGLIIDKETFNNKCHTFIGKIDYNKFREKYSINEIEISPIIDGTMINIYFDEKWRFSTKNKLDANKSHWQNDKSFYELFCECCKLDLDLLDKKICYSFIIVHYENRIVVKNKDNHTYLSLARNIETGEDVTNNIDINKIGINILKLPIIKFSNYEELEKNIETQKYDKIGYMLKANNDRCKITNIEYNNVKELVGNVPDRWENYLKLEKKNKIKEYLFYFNEYKNDYEELVSIRRKLLNYILTLYYISRKKYIKFPSYIAKTIYELHKIYTNVRK